jgi:hypothetical protein
MDKGVRGWIYTTAKENYWRVNDFYELDDLIQDGYLKYEYIRIRYPNAKNQKHLMGLFKRAYTNHIHDLSRKRTMVRKHMVTESDLEYPLTVGRVVNPDTSPAIALLPPDVRALFHALMTDPRAKARLRRRLDRTRQTTNEFFCRLIGADPSQTNVHLVLSEALTAD